MKKTRKKVELVSPAGDLEKLHTVFRYGADAAYLGGEEYNLRERCNNFSMSDLKKTVSLADKLDKKIYFTLNAYFYEKDIKELPAYLKKIKNTGIQALIVSDPGAVALIRDKFPLFKLHLSTQANTTNSWAVNAYKKMGIKRIVLSRELTLKDIATIKKEVPTVEVETFVHGAMCLAYSGRCFLSHYFTGRNANKGDCSHTCRWEYYLLEKKRNDEPLQVINEDKGTFILSSRDMNLIRHVPEFIEAGIDAFKIEGRMKSLYYAAVVTKIYREAIDAYYDGEKLPEHEINELEHVSHRPYFTGFYFEEPYKMIDTQMKDGNYIRSYDFIGFVEKIFPGKMYKIKIMNMIKKEHVIEVFSPEPGQKPFILKNVEFHVKKSNTIEKAEMLKIQDEGYLTCDEELGPGYMLRLRFDASIPKGGRR